MSWYDDFLKKREEGTIGTETLNTGLGYLQEGSQNVSNFIKRDDTILGKADDWVVNRFKDTGHLLGDWLSDASTLEGNERYNPADLITYGTLKTLNLMALGSKTLIGDPVKHVAHKGLGLDERIAGGVGLAAEMFVPVAATKVAKFAKVKSLAYLDNAYGIFSATGMGTGAHGGLLKGAVNQRMLFNKQYSRYLGHKRVKAVRPRLPKDIAKEYLDYGYELSRTQVNPRTGLPSIAGHAKKQYKGNWFDLKWTSSKGKERYLKVRSQQTKIAAETKRARMQVEQTINAGDVPTFKVGHHRFELNLGEAITKGMTQRQKRNFWRRVNKEYPDLLTGNAPGNIIGANREFASKTGKLIHDNIHALLEQRGLTAETMNWLGAPLKTRLNFMGEVDRILKEVDLQILEMTKNAPLSSPLK